MTTLTRNSAQSLSTVALFAAVMAVLGLVHIVEGLPEEPERWSEGGGAVGYLAAIPLATGLTVWVAVPVLLLLSG